MLSALAAMPGVQGRPAGTFRRPDRDGSFDGRGRRRSRTDPRGRRHRRLDHPGAHAESAPAASTASRWDRRAYAELTAAIGAGTVAKVAASVGLRQLAKDFFRSTGRRREQQLRQRQASPSPTPSAKRQSTISTGAASARPIAAALQRPTSKPCAKPFAWHASVAPPSSNARQTNDRQSQGRQAHRAAPRETYRLAHPDRLRPLRAGPDSDPARQPWLLAARIPALLDGLRAHHRRRRLFCPAPAPSRGEIVTSRRRRKHRPKRAATMRCASVGRHSRSKPGRTSKPSHNAPIPTACERRGIARTRPGHHRDRRKARARGSQGSALAVHDTEALAIIERVSRRLRLFVLESIPFGDRMTVAQALASTAGAEHSTELSAPTTSGALSASPIPPRPQPTKPASSFPRP